MEERQPEHCFLVRKSKGEDIFISELLADPPSNEVLSELFPQAEMFPYSFTTSIYITNLGLKVLKLRLDGLRTDEIADRLNITQSQASKRVTDLKKKLGEHVLPDYIRIDTPALRRLRKMPVPITGYTKLSELMRDMPSDEYLKQLAEERGNIVNFTVGRILTHKDLLVLQQKEAGKSNADIGREMGVKGNYVRVWLRNIRTMLRRNLDIEIDMPELFPPERNSVPSIELENSQQEISPDQLPFTLPLSFGTIKHAMEECPDIYCISIPEKGEYYAVLPDAPIPPEARLYGQEVSDQQGLRLYDLDDTSSGYAIIRYEICKYRSRHKLPQLDDESLNSAALFGMDLNPEYFGDCPVPINTPWGPMLRYKRIANGVFLLDTATYDHILVLSYPRWFCDLPEETHILGVKSRREKKHQLDGMQEYMFFHPSRCDMVLRQLRCVLED